MKITKTIIVIIFSFVNLVLKGQIPTPDVEKLQINSSPAYVLLGVQPDNIDRPSTPRDFIAGVQSAVVNGTLQPNVAIEFNPLSWIKKPQKKGRSNQFYADDYLYGNSWAAIKKNFALSVATSQSDTVVFGQLQPGMGLGYGLRWTLVPGKLNETVNKAFLNWEKADIETAFLQSMRFLISSIVDGESYKNNLKKCYDQVLQNINTNPGYLPLHNKILIDHLNELNQIFLDKLNDPSFESKLNDKNSNEFKGFSDYIETRYIAIQTEKKDALRLLNSRKVPFDREGFTLELAAATVEVLENNEWSKGKYAKTGIWLTPSYRYDLSNETDTALIQSIDIMGVIRYVNNSKMVDSASYWDYGVKFQFNRNQFNLGFEYTGRRASQVPENISSHSTYCWLISGGYKVNENVTFKCSFGSNFDGNTRSYTEPNKIFVVGGLNLGFLKL